MEGHPQGTRRAQGPLPAHGARGDPRRRVHVGHVRAHRDDPADVRRPVRQHLQGHRRGRARPGGVQERLRARVIAAATDPRVAGRRRASARRASRPRTGNVQIDYAQIVDKHGKAIGKGHGPPTLGFGWDPNPKLNQFHIVAGPARPRTTDEIVIDKRTRRQGQLQGRQIGDRAHRPAAQEVHDRRASRGSATADSLAGRVHHAVHDARGADDRRELGQVRRDQRRRQARASPRTRSRPTSRTTLATTATARIEVITGKAITKENQDAINKALGFLNIGLLMFALHRADRRRVHHLQHVLDRRRAAHSARWHCCARSARAGARCSARCIGESLMVGVIASRDRHRRRASASPSGCKALLNGARHSTSRAAAWPCTASSDRHRHASSASS